MNRRESLSHILVASGALIALPSWAKGWDLSGIPVTNGVFNEKEIALLTSVADTIIPAGNSIGALAVGVDKFLVGLFSRCYETPIQDSIKQVLAAVDAQALGQFNKSFADGNQPSCLLVVSQMLNNEDKSLKDAMNLIKSETIRGFTTSKEVMTTYLNYKVIPGHYYGCVPVNS